MIDFSGIGAYIGNLFMTWLDTLFVAPFRDIDMLWFLLPVWISWIFAEFFQEKRGTSYGNAISNALIIIWASVDCIRETIRLFSEGILFLNLEFLFRFLVIIPLLLFGIFVLVSGIRGRHIARHLGRIREATYVFIIFVPIMYNVTSLSLEVILAAILFFPLFYLVVEIILGIMPTPEAMKKDMEEEGEEREKKEPPTEGFGPDTTQAGTAGPNQGYDQNYPGYGPQNPGYGQGGYNDPGNQNYGNDYRRGY